MTLEYNALKKHQTQEISRNLQKSFLSEWKKKTKDEKQRKLPEW